MEEYTLTEDTRKSFYNIFETLFETKKKLKRKRDLETVTEVFNEKNNRIPDIICLPLHLKAISILKKLKYTNFDPKCVTFEFHRRNYSNFGQNKRKFKDFSWHYDDYNVAPFKLYTLIFYLRKDTSVKGGNLLYDLEESEEKNIRTFEVSEGKVAIFPGDIYHSPEPSKGFGCRDSIVIFVKRLD